MLLIRCLGHDDWGKIEAAWGLEPSVHGLLGWMGLADVSEILLSDWPLWRLCRLLSSARSHQFVLTLRDGKASENLAGTPALRHLWFGEQQQQESGEHPGGMVWASLAKRGWPDTAGTFRRWVRRLLLALKRSGPEPVEDEIVVFVEAWDQVIFDACRSEMDQPSLTGGAQVRRAPPLSCVLSAPGASAVLDLYTAAWALLSAGRYVALLDMHAIVFPGLGDRLTWLMATWRNTTWTLMVTDRLDESGGHLREPPYIDVALRVLRPVEPTTSLLHTCVHFGYKMPLEAVDSVCSRFGRDPRDIALAAIDGFVSTQGWRADKDRSRSVVLFSPRPFHLVPHWFEGGACARACGAAPLLQCGGGSWGFAGDGISACGFLDNQDELLLAVLRRSFALPHSTSLANTRPRLLQIGPSGCATTAIATFYTLHGLRVVKSFVQSIEIRVWIRRAMSEGLPPLHYLDDFDVITDAFDTVRGGIHFCSDRIGPGGTACEALGTDYLEVRWKEFGEILEAVRDAYPNVRFLLNMRHIDAWLAKRVYNCWPNLVNPHEDWGAWSLMWERCCNPPGTFNEDCWQGLVLPPHFPHSSTIAYHACCEGVKFYTEAFQETRKIALRVVGAERVLLFNIDHADPRQLSEFMGLEDRYDVSFWRRIHASPPRSQAVTEQR